MKQHKCSVTLLKIFYITMQFYEVVICNWWFTDIEGPLRMTEESVCCYSKIFHIRNLT